MAEGNGFLEMLFKKYLVFRRSETLWIVLKPLIRSWLLQNSLERFFPDITHANGKKGTS